MPSWSGILHELSKSGPPDRPPDFDRVRRKVTVQEGPEIDWSEIDEMAKKVALGLMNEDHKNDKKSDTWFG